MLRSWVKRKNSRKIHTWENAILHIFHDPASTKLLINIHKALLYVTSIILINVAARAVCRWKFSLGNSFFPGMAKKVVLTYNTWKTMKHVFKRHIISYIMSIMQCDVFHYANIRKRKSEGWKKLNHIMMREDT